MAINIRQEPTSPNMANSNLVWMVTSGLTGNPQYQYVMDIYQSGSSDLIQRVKQQPNPSNKGIFDLGTILPTQLDGDNVWKAAPFSTSRYSNKDFVVKFGEEYGTSISSSVTMYDGANNPGEPSVTGLNYYTITDGLVEPNSGDWNFASSSYYIPELASTPTVFSHNVTLSNFPKTQSIQEGEYQTISVYNGNVDNSISTAQDIFYYQITWYDATGTQIQNNDFYNIVGNGGGPRTSEPQLWADVYRDQTNRTRLLHIGVGPQNLEDAGVTIPATWAYYTVTLNSQSDDGLEDGDSTWEQLRFNKSEAVCGLAGKRFAWKNEFGVWDYFTFKLAESTTSNIERNSYEQSFVNYSEVSTSLPYSTERRGKSQYYNKVEKSYTVESDYLTQEYADILREMFYSTDVYIQDGTDFYPVVIDNANITEKTNPRSQKLFRYTAQYRFANSVRPRV